jgi:hypothetical protein
MLGGVLIFRSGVGKLCKGEKNSTMMERATEHLDTGAKRQRYTVSGPPREVKCDYSATTLWFVSQSLHRGSVPWESRCQKSAKSHLHARLLRPHPPPADLAQ